MKILSIECSATPSSVAITEDDKILAYSFLNVKITHSQTLMPMIENIINTSGIKLEEIDAFAVSNGPGSFTGIRIGISAIKGIATGNNKPCVAVSTLETIAQNYIDTNCIVCAVMDARCNQVYNANFEISNGEIKRLCGDRALLCSELREEIENIAKTKSQKIFIVGDGAEIFYKFVNDIDSVSIAVNEKRFQNAASVGILAKEKIKCGEVLNATELLPVYLRLPQAERELKLKKENEK